MYYTIYKTINITTMKEYIGQHQTVSLDDNYIGSGVELKKDIRIYGRDNFNTEILFVYDNFDDMNKKEIELVTEEYINRGDTYNIILGGLLQHPNNIGMLSVKDSDGNNLQVTKDDPRYLSGALVGATKGLAVVKDSDGNTFSVRVDDPRYLSGELVGATKGVGIGLVPVKDNNGNTFRVPKDDPRYLSGELVGNAKGLRHYHHPITKKLRRLDPSNPIVESEGFILGKFKGQTGQ